MGVSTNCYSHADTFLPCAACARDHHYHHDDDGDDDAGDNILNKTISIYFLAEDFLGFARSQLLEKWRLGYSLLYFLKLHKSV